LYGRPGRHGRHGGSTAGAARWCGQVRLGNAHRVGGEHRRPGRESRRPRRERPRQLGGQRPVDLDGEHCADPGLEQGQRERAEPWPDLEHHIVRPQGRQRSNPPHRALFHHEVLPEPLGGPHPEAISHTADLGRPEQPHGRLLVSHRCRHDVTLNRS